MKQILLFAMIILLPFIVLAQTYEQGCIIFDSKVKINVIAENPALITDQEWFNGLVKDYNINLIKLITDGLIPEPIINSYLYYYIEFDSTYSVETVLNSFNLQSKVNIAEFNSIGQLCNGANTNDEWHNNMWNVDKIGMNQVWQENIEFGNENVIVAVIDTGIDNDNGVNDNEVHEDLVGNIWQGESGNYGFNPAAYLMDEFSFEVFYDTHDEVGHGTFIAGIISGINNNNLGIASVAGGWVNPGNSRINGCKVLPILGRSRVHFIIALLIAYNNRANIISISQIHDDDPVMAHNIMHMITEDQLGHGVTPLIVVAAGNGEGESYGPWPCEWDEVLCVSATDESDKVCDFSSYGTHVDVSAPGGASVNVDHTSGFFSTLPMEPSFSMDLHCNPGYDYSYGTSFSAPQVAGVAALVLSHYPNLTASQLRSRLLGTSDNIYNTQEQLLGKLGSGRINAYRALTEEEKPSVRINKLSTNSTPNYDLFIGQTNELSIQLKNWWIQAHDVYGFITTNDPGVHISYEPNQYNMTYWSDINTEATANNLIPVYINVDDGDARTVEFVLHIVGDNIPPYDEVVFSLPVHYNMNTGSINLNLANEEYLNNRVASKDINNDSFDELVVSTNQGNVFIVNENDNPIQCSTNSDMICTPVIGDINSDQQYEIVAGNNLGELYIWDCNGNTVSSQPFLLPGVISRLSIDDVNGDGQLDIIAALQKDLHIQNCIDGFAIINMVDSSVHLNSINRRIVGDFAIADVNNCGKKEIACVCRHGYNINGSIGTRTGILVKVFEIDSNFGISEHNITEIGSGLEEYMHSSGPVIANLNEDNSIEIIISYFLPPSANPIVLRDLGTGYVSVFSNVLSNVSQWTHEYQQVSWVSHQLIVGDFSPLPGLEILVDFGEYIITNENILQIDTSSHFSPVSGISNAIVIDINRDNELEYVRMVDNTLRVYNSQFEELPEWSYIVSSSNPFMGLALLKVDQESYSIAITDKNGRISFLPIEFDKISPYIYTQHQYNSRHTGFYSQPLPELIRYDIVIKNDVFLERDVQIDSQITIQPSVRIVSDPNRVVIINGTLNATGDENNFIHFSGTCLNSNIGYWQGLEFRNESSSTLCFMKIANARNGISYSDYGNHSLAKSVLSNNGHGLSIYNTSPYLYNNKIYDNANCGIDVYHNSTPYMGNESPQRTGRNAIYDNQIGIFVNQSTPHLKEGHNDFDNSIWNIFTHDVAPFSAQRNWWGSNLLSEINQRFNEPNLIAYNPWDSAPNIIINYTPEQIFEMAMNHLLNDEFSQAIPLFHQILADSLETDADYISIKSLLICYEKTDNLGTYEIFINQQLSGNLSETMRKCYKECLALIKRILKEYNAAIAYYENVLDNNPSFADSCYAVIDIGNAYLESDGKASGRYSYLIPKSFKDHIQTSHRLLQELIAISNENVLIPTPQLVLNQNYPNPFNPSTAFSFFVPKEGRIELTVFNIKGQKVITLMNKNLTKGNHKIVWNGYDSNNKNVGSGVYLYKLSNGSKSIIKKCLIFK